MVLSLSRVSWRWKMLENRDYVIIDPEDGYDKKDQLAKVQIVTGDFMETVFSFGVVTMNEDKYENESLTISFDYEVLSPNKEQILKESKVEFEDHISLILNSILMNTIDKAEEKYNNESREQNS